MNKEQIEELAKALAAMRDSISEIESIIEDYGQCRSEVSRKYLAAAIKKHSSALMTSIPAGIFD